MGGQIFKEKYLIGIKNIIFDLGGVIIGIDYHSTINRFKEIGVSNFDKMFGQFKQTELFDLYEKGLISPENFRESIKNISGISIQNDLFDNAWNAMILELPLRNIQLLRNLKKHYNTFLFSNTNEIHLDYFFNYVEQKLEVRDFESLFNKAYYSCRMNKRKPDIDSFQVILDENGLHASETLFIDDTIINIEGALKAGIKTYHLQKGEEICELFSEFA